MGMMREGLLGLILFGIMINSQGEIKHPRGVLNEAVRQDNLSETVCKANWTDSIRPRSSYTNRIKFEQLEDKSVMRDYEEDHFIPLSIGGHPTDVGNLWPQSWYGSCGAKEKDKEEVRIHNRLCKGEISLKEAQDYFFNWRCK